MHQQLIYMFVTQSLESPYRDDKKTSAEAEVRNILCKTQSFLPYLLRASLSITHQIFNQIKDVTNYSAWNIEII